MMRPALRTCSLALAAGALISIAADDGTSGPMAADKAALSPLQAYIGAWKGVGQPKRGSTAGAWSEQSDWAWQFKEDGAAIVFESAEGKYFRAGRLTPGNEAGAFQFVGTLLDGQEEGYSGSLESDGRLVLKADDLKPDRPAQISIRLVAAGDRMLILYEKRQGTTGYARLAEVGYTRKGSGFGKGNSGPECVVTGGYGSMSVEYQGQTYYVCCTGCRDLFNDDPEGVLADYRERKAKEREEAAEE
jgi:hypothetical protein